MRKRRAVAGLGVAMLMVATLIAGGVLIPGHGILLVVLLALAAVVGSWATDVPQMKATAFATGGLAILAIARRKRDR